MSAPEASGWSPCSDTGHAAGSAAPGPADQDVEEFGHMDRVLRVAVLTGEHRPLSNQAAPARARSFSARRARWSRNTRTVPSPISTVAADFSFFGAAASTPSPARNLTGQPPVLKSACSLECRGDPARSCGYGQPMVVRRSRIHAQLFFTPTELTHEMIVRAVESAVQETDDLDWKQALPVDADKKLKEFAKDVAAMANTNGGVIVYGVREDDQRDWTAPCRHHQRARTTPGTGGTPHQAPDRRRRDRSSGDGGGR